MNINDFASQMGIQITHIDITTGAVWCGNCELKVDDDVLDQDGYCGYCRMERDGENNE
jgi:Zn finger protein HypA/HybF involved in hydrogenase expression